jgi:hypothetical protein
LTYLIIGAVRQHRHRRWQAGESVALMRSWAEAPQLELGPWMLGSSDRQLVGGGAQLRLHF